MEEITIYVISNGIEKPLKIPLGISISLMEVLKAYDEPITATCGGIALCASCLIEILNDGMRKIGELTEEEICMLETLPEYVKNSRLSCQLPITEALDGIRISYLQTIITS